MVPIVASQAANWFPLVLKLPSLSVPLSGEKILGVSVQRRPASQLFWRKGLDFIDIVLLHSSPDRVLLEESKITHKYTGKVAGALCRLQPSLLHPDSPPSPAMKNL